MSGPLLKSSGSTPFHIGSSPRGGTMDDVTTIDLPIVSRPGDVGVHQDADGGIWIPIGLNPLAKSLQSNTFFAQMQRRKEWDANTRAGGKRKRGQIMTALCECSYCEIKVGRG